MSGATKSDLAKAAKKERQLQNKLKRQKALPKVANGCKDDTTSDLSEDSFNSVENNDHSLFEFQSASKFFHRSPLSAKNSSKRSNSDDESEKRRTRSKSNNFRIGSLLVSEVSAGDGTNSKQ